MSCNVKADLRDFAEVLRDWMQRQSVGYGGAAIAFGCTTAHISYWASGKHQPRDKAKAKMLDVMADMDARLMAWRETGKLQ